VRSVRLGNGYYEIIRFRCMDIFASHPSAKNADRIGHPFIVWAGEIKSKTWNVPEEVRGVDKCRDPSLAGLRIAKVCASSG
jgi:hypothetical protein